MRDRGAAVVEFAMISVLLVLLLFGVLQVAVYFYVRNIVAASASAGARYAGSLDATYSDGAQRAQSLVADGTAGQVARDVRCEATATRDAASGLALAQVRCHGPFRLFFLPVDLPLTIDVTAQSLKEQAPQ